MRMRVLREKLRVEIENEMRVFLESLNFEIEMRVSQKSVKYPFTQFSSIARYSHMILAVTDLPLLFQLSYQHQSCVINIVH